MGGDSGCGQCMGPVDVVTGCGQRVVDILFTVSLLLESVLSHLYFPFNIFVNCFSFLFMLLFKRFLKSHKGDNN